MVSKEALVGIGIAIGLVVGLGVGFGLTSTTSNLEKQIEEQSSRITSLELDLESANESIETLQQSSPDMQSMIQMIMGDPDMMKQMNISMMEDSEKMQQMMESMLSDPELKQSMMEHMTQMQELMGEDMMGDSMSKQMQFNVNVPITIPMIDGYYNGEKVFFIHTEFSTSDMANAASMMINFPTLHASQLQEIPSEETGKIYVFTNGIPGSGPYGGGPFMFQIDIFDSIPGQQGYSQFRVIHLVAWDDDSTPRILTSLDELLQAQTNGEVSIEKTDLVVNAPMIVWSSDDGIEQTASMIQNMFESMEGVDGEVVKVDVDNYIATFKLKSDKKMNMMN